VRGWGGLLAAHVPPYARYMYLSPPIQEHPDSGPAMLLAATCQTKCLNPSVAAAAA
jgi:hypothetical protein